MSIDFIFIKYIISEIIKSSYFTYIQEDYGNFLKLWIVQHNKTTPL